LSISVSFFGATNGFAGRGGPWHCGPSGGRRRLRGVGRALRARALQVPPRKQEAHGAGSSAQFVSAWPRVPSPGVPLRRSSASFLSRFCPKPRGGVFSKLFPARCRFTLVVFLPRAFRWCSQRAAGASRRWRWQPRPRRAAHSQRRPKTPRLCAPHHPKSFGYASKDTGRFWASFPCCGEIYPPRSSTFDLLCHGSSTSTPFCPTA